MPVMHPRAFLRLALAVVLAGAAPEPAQAVSESERLPRLPILVPFPDCGSTVLLPVRVNGNAPRLYILDSGANSIVLDHGLADSLGLRPVATGEGTGAGAGTVAYRRYPRDSVTFDVAGVSFRSDHSISLDLSNQPGILGVSVGGILGTDFFQRVVVETNYDARVVRLHDPAHYTPAPDAQAIPLTFERRLPYVTAQLTVTGVQPRTRRLLVDSGSEDAVDDSLLLESRGPLRRTIGGVGLGKTYEVVFGRIDRFELGPFVLESLPGVAPGVALIGGEVLRRFRVTLDYARARMLLSPGRHFGDRAPEDLSGLTLRLAADGTRLRVEEVARDSRAAQAGIRAGDMVTAVDGAPVRDLGLRSIQSLLTVPGERLRLRIEPGARDVSLRLSER